MKYRSTTDFDHSQPEKLGVLLVNLGTPQAPTAKALKPYLKEFLWDPRVVEIPRVVWWCILNGIIVPFRSKKSAAAYKSIWTEQGSPLLANTKAISDGIKDKFSDNSDVLVDFAMRYGEPAIDNKISDMFRQGVRKLLVLPLYPQYSGTTTASVFDAVAQSFNSRRWFPELRFVNQYHEHPAYIKALANKVRAHWAEHGQADKLILSFHGVPKRVWVKGDPYVCQCMTTSRLLREELGLEESQLQLCFQSRFGSEEWAKPYTSEVLKALPEQGIKSVQVFCPGFSADCLETLEEIAEENKEYFIEAGGEKFDYIPCLNDDDEHLDALVEIISNNIQGWSVNVDRALTAELKQAKELSGDD